MSFASLSSESMEIVPEFNQVSPEDGARFIQQVTLYCLIHHTEHIGLVSCTITLELTEYPQSHLKRNLKGRRACAYRSNRAITTEDQSADEYWLLNQALEELFLELRHPIRTNFSSRISNFVLKNVIDWSMMLHRCFVRWCFRGRLKQSNSWCPEMWN